MRSLGISSPQPLSNSTVAPVAFSNRGFNARSNVCPQGPAHVNTVKTDLRGPREHPQLRADARKDRLVQRFSTTPPSVQPSTDLEDGLHICIIEQMSK